VLHILAQHQREGARPSDENMVETFASQRADAAFYNRVRPWCSGRRADDADPTRRFEFAPAFRPLRAERPTKFDRLSDVS
jgi:hypothetical protein